MSQEVKLQKKLIDLIQHKAIVECPHKALRTVSTYVKQLKDYIEGHINLTATEIDKKLDYIIGCTTITLNLPVENREFLRARICNIRTKKCGDSDFFDNVQDLSYIKDIVQNPPSMGRLNIDGEVLFYASVIVDNSDIALLTVLSEIGAKSLDKVGVLRSQQIAGTELQLRCIGIWEFVRLKQKPMFMDQEVFEYYQEAYDLMKKRFPADLLTAYNLTDCFLSDVMSMKGSDKLYQITSVAASVLLDDKNVDGILYTSVEAGFPSVAIKPASVDQKIQHDYVCDVDVIKHHGYSFYEYQDNKKFTINTSTGALQ